MLLEMADELLSAGRFTEARNLYQQVCALEPSHSDAHFALGAISAEEGDAASAEQHLCAALASNPAHAGAHLHLADLLARQGQYQRALSHAQRAVDYDQKHADAWLLFGMLQARCGNLTAAETSSRHAVELQPDNAESHLNLGKVLRSLGQQPGAIAAVERALALAPECPEALTLLAQIQLERGALPEALMNASTALKIQTNNAEAWFVKGVAHARQDDLKQAHECFRQATARRPDYLAAYINLGQSCLILADPVGAEAAYRKAVEIQHDNSDARAGLADALNRCGRHQEAMLVAKSGLGVNPDHVHCRLALASALAMLGHDEEAANQFRTLLQKNPALVPAHARLAQLYLSQGRITAALEHQRAALRIDPDNPQLHCNLASGLQLAGRLHEAMGACSQALSLAPGLPEAIACQASILERQGNIHAAIEKLEPLLSGSGKAPGAALAFARLSPQLGREEEGIRLLEEQLASQMPPAATKDKMHKLLAKLYDGTGDYKRAIAHNNSAHALRKTRFDTDAHDKLVDNIIASLNAAALDTVYGQGHPDKRPVFIVGMPRSGTSLAEQILASHPGVHGAGELADLPELAASLASATNSGSHFPFRLTVADSAQFQAHAQRYLELITQINPNAARITDKLPHNFIYLGVIQTLLPNARVIHIRRNPLDTCLSCYLQDFSSGHAYAYDLTHLGHYYRAYVRLMDHWRMTLRIPLLEIDYEQIVADLEGEARKLIEFCGLPWHGQCLRFHETQRTVSTPSYEQVRRPLYASSVGRWHHYEEWLAPLVEALGPIAQAEQISTTEERP